MDKQKAHPEFARKNNGESPPLVFHHIPKTGGHTIATTLASAFPTGTTDIIGADITEGDGLITFRKLIEENKFIERHIFIPVFAENFDFPIDILTAVRDPVQHIASNYFHILREPRSPLHKAVTSLKPREFFNDFGDHLSNRQVKFFNQAFFAKKIDNSFSKELDDLEKSIKKLKYLVPTEKINEFIHLWAIDNHVVPNINQKDLNKSPDNAGLKSQVEDIIQNIPKMYALDTIFKEITDKFYESYTFDLLNRFSNPEMNNWGTAFLNGSNLVQLGLGWYPPEKLSNGLLAWWTGPDAASIISLKRTPPSNYLTFKVIVFCGAKENEVVVTNHYDEALPTFKKRHASGHVTYAVKLEDIALQQKLKLKIPISSAPALVNSSSYDFRRQGVAVTEFSILHDLDVGEYTTHQPNYYEKNLHAGSCHN